MSSFDRERDARHLCQRPSLNPMTIATFFSKHSHRFYLWCLWCGWVLTVCAVQLWRLTHLNDTGFDLAIYSQVLWNATHGHGWFSSIQDHSYWSDHLEPVLWLYWPLMKLWWSPLWLLWSQTLIIASAVFPLYRLSRRVLSPYLALVIPLLFLIHPSTWNTATIEFHVLSLSIPLIMWAGVLLVEAKVRWWQWALILTPLALVREEMGLVVLGFGVLAAIKKRGWRWWVPAVVIGVSWSIGARLIQAEFVDTYRYTYYFPWIDLLAQGHLAAAASSIFHLIFRLEVLRMLLEAVLAFGIIWVLSAEWVLPALPVIGSFIVLDANISNALVEGYHSSVVLALVFVALPFGLDKLQRWLKIQKHTFASLPVGVLLSILSVIQLSTWYFLWTVYPPQANQLKPEELAMLLRPIQAQEGVAASAEFLPTLANRSVLQPTWYVFRGQDEFLTSTYVLDPEVNWIVFNTQEFLDLRTQRDDFWEEHQRFLNLLNTQFAPVDHLGSVILYQRTNQPTLRTTVIPLLQEYQSGTVDALPTTDESGDGLDVVDEFVVPGPDTHVVGNHLFVDFFLHRPERWRQLEQQFITPIIRVTSSSGQSLTVPLAYGQISPDTIQEGDRVVMDIILPERMLRAGKSNSSPELRVTGELIQLLGLTYGRHASIVGRSTWIETFLDKTVPIE